MLLNNNRCYQSGGSGAQKLQFPLSGSSFSRVIEQNKFKRLASVSLLQEPRAGSQRLLDPVGKGEEGSFFPDRPHVCCKPARCVGLGVGWMERRVCNRQKCSRLASLVVKGQGEFQLYCLY